MKVLILNTVDRIGGAAIAIYNLHQALVKQKIDSQMLVQNKTVSDSTIIGPDNEKQRIWRDLAPHLENYLLRFFPYKNVISLTLFSPFTLKKIKKINPDIVHLNWICDGFLTPETIAKINTPVVWTLQDEWPFCGTEHYSSDIRFEKGYFKKNSPKDEKIFDPNLWLWNRKKKNYKKINNLTIVAPSKSMAILAQKSFLFKKRKVVIIPNGIDTDFFSPINKSESKTILNLPKNKKIILFGAQHLNDQRKNNLYSKQIIEKIVNSSLGKNCFFVFFGAYDQKPNFKGVSEKNSFFTDQIYDQITMKVLYSCADVFLVTSTKEAFSLVTAEAMACETPVIAFKIGGPAEIIDHDINGYLVKPFDVLSFVSCVKRLLENKKLQNSFAKQSRKKIIAKYEIKEIAKQYQKLYQSILKKGVEK